MRLEEITPSPCRVLLVNTHAIDIRLPWPNRHQPTGLLQIGSALKKRECDVRLIDCLGWDVRRRVRRRKVGHFDIEGYKIDAWRFGGLWGHIAEQIWALKREKWFPDQVYVSCPMSTWWEASAELITRLRHDWFPAAEIILGGTYPTVEPNHAQLYKSADMVVSGSIAEASTEMPDLTLYTPERMPRFAGIYLYRSRSVLDVESGVNEDPREPELIAQEMANKVAMGVSEFAFFDEEIALAHRQHFIEVLRAIEGADLDIRLTAIGNISPVTIDGEIAALMKRAGYRQIYLRSDLILEEDSVSYATPYKAYEECVSALHQEAGFRPRTGDVTAVHMVGFPREDIQAATERLIRLATIVGAVSLVPFQYSSGSAAGKLFESLITQRNGQLNLPDLNCKLYPLARLSGAPYEDYMDLTRLSALLNSKYRSKTFDFLGDGIIARGVRDSIRSNSWHPFREMSVGDHADTIPLTPNQSGGPDDR